MLKVPRPKETFPMKLIQALLRAITAYWTAAWRDPSYQNESYEDWANRQF